MGSQTHAGGWIRRVHTDGTTVWAHDDTRAEAAFAIDGVIAIAGGNDDWPFIATFDPTSGAEVVHLTLPSTPGPTHGVARAPAGLVLVGATPNGLAWLRRITPWSTCHGIDCTPEGCPADASAE
ncbi:MAG: hypothetical protein U1F43_29745 [Myxococcota bacterium]